MSKLYCMPTAFPWVADGVHVNCPVEGLIEAPLGGFFSRLKVKSSNELSVTTAVKESVFPSVIVLSSIVLRVKTKSSCCETLLPSYCNCIVIPSSSF